MSWHCRAVSWVSRRPTALSDSRQRKRLSSVRLPGVESQQHASAVSQHSGRRAGPDQLAWFVAFAVVVGWGLNFVFAEVRRSGSMKGGPLSAGTVARVHVVLRSASSQAVRWEWIWDNPAQRAIGS